MWRFLSVSLLVPFILLTPSAARAADEEPVFQRKTLTEWIELQRGEKALAERQTWLAALGCSASHPEAWKWQTRLREAGLIAVTLIGPQKSPKVFPAILGTLRDDPDESLRRAAAVSLGRLGAKVHDDNVEMRGMPIKLDDVRDGLVIALRGDKSPKVREASARSLGQLKDSAVNAVPVLAVALQDAHEGTQTAAGESLRILGKTIAVRDQMPRLEEALKNPKTNTQARVQVAITLGIVGQSAPAAVDVNVLADILKDDKAPDDLRVAVAVALGKLGKTSAIGELTNALAAPASSLELRRACLASLDNFGPAAAPALKEFRKGMSDKNMFIRTQSMHALGQLGKELGPDAKAIVVELLKMTSDSVFEVRLAAIETLGNLGPDAIPEEQINDVRARMIELMKDGNRAVRETAENAKKKLK